MKRQIVVVGLLGTLLGCGGGGASSAPTVLPPVAATTTSSPMSPPSAGGGASQGAASTAAVDAKALPTAAGAEAYARFWMAEFDRAYATMNPDIIASMSTNSCLSCREYISDLQRVQAAGHRYDGGGSTVTEVVSAPVDHESAAVLVVYAAAVLRIVDGQGSVVETVPAEPRVVLNINLLRKDNAWEVNEVTRS